MVGCIRRLGVGRGLMGFRRRPFFCSTIWRGGGGEGTAGGLQTARGADLGEKGEEAHL